MKEEFEFDEQRPDEKVILVARKHPWVLAKSGLVMILVVLIIVLSFLIFGASLTSSIVLVAGLIFATIYGLIRWFVYSSDIYILSNERIINIEQSGFFSRRVTEAELANILNVSYEIKGAIKSILNFGDINIDTSGSDSNFLVLRNIENPHFIQEKIVSQQKKAQDRGGASFSDRSIN